MQDYKLKRLSDEELRKMSLEKQKNGCATSEALSAQRILYERATGGFRRIHSSTKDFYEGTFRMNDANIIG